MLNELTALQIPDDWIALLKQLQQDDPSAIIAGGAIRDLYCGRNPIKDIDFFTKSSIGFPQFQVDASEIDYEGMEYVNGIGWYPNAKPLPCNVIFGYGYDTTMQLIESFDFGICQIAFDGNNIIKTPAFDWDFKYSVMTLRLTKRHADRRDSSLIRYGRWREKYPEFAMAEVAKETA